jgi:ribonuclease J
MTAAEDLLFLPLGGAGEIGMNLNLFGYRNRWLMVDLGVTFGEDAMPGIDVITPDPAFIVEHKDKLDGLVLTHAHEDHLGAVPYLWPRLECPVYATGFTASVLRRKLAEVGLEAEVPITEVRPGSRFTVGPFEIELVTLTHSILEPNALVIRTPHGAIFHTGDWKLDPDPLIGEPVDEDALRRLGDQGVLAMIGDSTNVFREGRSGSEAAVRESLIELVGQYDRRVAIASFASNVARLETIATAADANGRHAALVGRSLWRMYEAARENGYLRDIRPFLTPGEAADLPRDKMLIACTGSQGEPRAALARIAARSHPEVELEEGDVVIFSSRIIPGNEKAIGRLHNDLCALGIEVISEQDHFVHVSGHPARDELVDMYQWIRPTIAVPVHGELRHLHAHRKLAQECQVPQTVVATNGELVRLAPGNPRIVDTVPSGRLALDGVNLVPLDGASIRERKRMMYDGAAVASLVVDTDGALLADPELTLYGLADDDDEDDLLYELVQAAIEHTIENLSRKKLRQDDELQEAVRLAVRRAIRGARGKRPQTDVHLIRLEDWEADGDERA